VITPNPYDGPTHASSQRAASDRRPAECVPFDEWPVMARAAPMGRVAKRRLRPVRMAIRQRPLLARSGQLVGAFVAVDVSIGGFQTLVVVGENGQQVPAPGSVASYVGAFTLLAAIPACRVIGAWLDQSLRRIVLFYHVDTEAVAKYDPQLSSTRSPRVKEDGTSNLGARSST
jgi:hypothetical protein